MHAHNEMILTAFFIGEILGDLVVIRQMLFDVDQVVFKFLSLQQKGTP
jgi:hypothetical protein